MFTGVSVTCEVAIGTFMSEYFIRIRTIDNVLWEGAVDKEMVLELEASPTKETYVKGRIYAYLISFDARSALIELPIEDSTAGRRISIPIGSVRKEKIPV